MTPRTLKRSPIGSLDDLEVAKLGRALEVEIPGRVIRWERGHDIAWSPSARALLIYRSGRGGRARYGLQSRAATSYRRFNGREAKYERDVTIPAARWQAYGPALRTDYASDKSRSRGKVLEYTHSHGRGVRLYRYGPTWVIAGGRLRVTAAGIEG